MAIEFGSPEARAVVAADKAAGFSDAREVRREVYATVECRCGLVVDIEAETEEWERDEETGRWVHSAFGPGIGICECGRFYADSWDGCRVYFPGKRIRA